MITGKATVAVTLRPEKGAVTIQTVDARRATCRQAPNVKSESFDSSVPVRVKGIEAGTGGTAGAPAPMRRGKSGVHRGICDMSKLATLWYIHE
jgi:hypothetical protein